MRRGLRALVVALSLVFVSAGLAAAHAELARSEPSTGASLRAAPEAVRLWFTEPVERLFTEVQVFTAGKKRADKGRPVFDPGDPAAVSVELEPLPAGTYTVSWQAISTVDGHRTQGVFTFTVGSVAVPAGAREEAGAGRGYPLGAAAMRWLVYMGALAAAGGFLFRVLVMPVMALPPPEGRAATRRWRRTMWWALGIAGAGSAGALVTQAAAVGGSAGDVSTVFRIVTSTYWGWVWLARGTLIAGMAAVTAAIRARDRRVQPASRSTADSVLSWTGVTLGLGLFVSLVLVSHATASSSLRPMSIASDIVHLVAGSVWVGGLVFLASAALPSLRAVPEAERRRVLMELVPRFSTLAQASAALLVATGAANTWLRVGSWGALLGTTYGLTLLAKLVAFALLVLAAAANFLYVRPRLQVPQGSTPEVAERLLGRGVMVEVGAAALLLLATGALTVLPPGRDVWARLDHPIRVGRAVEDVRVVVAIDPAVLGQNAYSVTLTDTQNRPVPDADVVVRFDYLEEAIAAQELPLRPVGEGVYKGEGTQLSVRGLWQALVQVRRPGAFDARIAFRFAVPAGGGNPEPRLPQVRPTFGKGAVIGLELAVLGVILVGIGLKLRAMARMATVPLAALGVVLLLVGTFMVLRAQVVPETVLAARKNPILPDAASLGAGRTIFHQQCSVCHGTEGQGDGPQAASLDLPPLDLTVHVPLHGDGDLYDFITDGVPGTAMPAFGRTMREDEVWHLVNYLRVLAAAGRR